MPGEYPYPLLLLDWDLLDYLFEKKDITGSILPFIGTIIKLIVFLPPPLWDGPTMVLGFPLNSDL